MASILLLGILILLQINLTLCSQFRVIATKAQCESLTDKAELNISITETGGLSLYLNLKEDLHDLYTSVNLAVDLNNRDEYDFNIVKRTVDCCKLFKDHSYEPLVQFLYKIFLENGHFPQQCPVKKDVYSFYDMKVDPKKFPDLMTERKAFLTIKHLVKERRRFKILAYYQVYFTVEKIEMNTNENITEAVLRTKHIKNSQPRN